jgi:hypothetical protein
MRKLSFEENLRHRLRSAKRSVPRFRYHDEKSAVEGALFLAIGAAAGLAAGVIIAQRYGGFSALTAKIRSRFSANGEEDHGEHHRFHGDAYHEDEEHPSLSLMEELEGRVLETYHNDPILSGCAIDIGAIDEGVVELTGWVRSTDEVEHAVIVAKGTPGVLTVVNRLLVREEDDDVSSNERWAGVDEPYRGDGIMGRGPSSAGESEPGHPRGD